MVYGESAKRDPVLVCQYGPPKLGKTVATGYAFPRAVFLAAPGALGSIVRVCGYVPKAVNVSTIEEATELIVEIGKSGKYDTVVVDDFSFMSEQTFSLYEKKYSGYKLWGELRDDGLNFRDKARYAGVNVILTCWEQGPKRKENGTMVRGGPQLSGRLPEQIPALCDLVLRATHEPKQRPWPVVYRCAPDPSYIMGDRLDVVSAIDPAPMNLGEIFRAGGMEVARHPGMPNQESQVETLANVFARNLGDEALVNEVYSDLLAAKVPVLEARWTVRDALDRALIRVELAESNKTFFKTSNDLVLKVLK